MRGADLDCRFHSFVFVVRRHAYVDDREVRLVLRDGCDKGLGVAHACQDGVSGVLEQSGQALADEYRVLRDHYSHGMAASMRVPPPSGLTISRVDRKSTRLNSSHM